MNMRAARPHRGLGSVAPPLAGMVLAVVAVGTYGARSHAQVPSPVDFARDIQPLLKERCLTCHGPAAQGSYRLDRRSSALGGVIRPNIIPGSSATSRLIARVTSSQFGTQMPPTGPLSQAEIALLTRWINEGAQWPDALANEIERPPDDPEAVQLSEQIQRGDRPAIAAALAATPRAVNGRGPGGTTPLMEAALYGDAALVGRMLAAGGDARAHNDAGATALMWALHDADLVRLLLDRGADPNAVSGFGRSTLQLAAGQYGAAPVVRLLLEHGAKATSAALTAASASSDVAVMRLVMDAGVRDTGPAVAAALRSGCGECLAAIAAVQPLPTIREALQFVLPPQSDGKARWIREALDRGGDVRLLDRKLGSVPMRAAIVDTLAPESMRLLLERGADPALKTPDGMSALDFARRLGRTPVADILSAAGSPARSVSETALTFVRGNTPAAAIRRSLPLLQRTTAGFYKTSGCVSCHHNVLTAMTVAAARARGFGVDEVNARENVTTLAIDGREARDQSLQGIVASGGLVTTTGYVLMGLAAERHPVEPAIDAQVRLLALAQRPDGSWPTAYRPPSEASKFTSTAVSLRGVQLYGAGHKWGRPMADVIAAAAAWLERTAPRNTEEYVFRLLGLTWAGTPRATRESARRDLLALQRADGGWAQVSTLPSDAYATGSALVALHEAGLRADADAYRRGVAFLLRTQIADGSWRVRTRSYVTQNYFESGFPHGADQFISMAATNWATQALVIASPAAAQGAR